MFCLRRFSYLQYYFRDLSYLKVFTATPCLPSGSCSRYGSILFSIFLIRNIPHFNARPNFEKLSYTKEFVFRFTLLESFSFFVSRMIPGSFFSGFLIRKILFYKLPYKKDFRLKYFQFGIFWDLCRHPAGADIPYSKDFLFDFSLFGIFCCRFFLIRKVSRPDRAAGARFSFRLYLIRKFLYSGLPYSECFRLQSAARPRLPRPGAPYLKSPAPALYMSAGFPLYTRKAATPRPRDAGSYFHVFIRGPHYTGGRFKRVLRA